MNLFVRLEKSIYICGENKGEFVEGNNRVQISNRSRG
jgi:hypothetical protein